MGLKLQAPWITYYDKIREFFRRDNEVKVVYNDDEFTINMYVSNPRKAEALNQILPPVRRFGNIEVKVNIIAPNEVNATPATIEDAFKGNPIYHFMRRFEEAYMSNPITYVVFAKEVIQYWNDDLGDLFGNANTLAEDIAKDIFVNVGGYFFCTDVK